MSGWSSALLVTTLGGIAATYMFFWALLHLTHNAREPVLLLTLIPFISPILGMIGWSKDFYAHMRERNPHLPIYTLRIPGARLYAINSSELIPAVQRQWRTLIFAPIQVKAAKAGMGASKKAIAVLERDMVTEKGFVNGMVKVTHPTMSNGSAGLDGLIVRAFEVFAGALDECDGSDGAGMSVSLYAWIGEVVIRATTEGVYGAENPMREGKNLEAWGQYHPALMYIMLDILPQNIFYEKAVQARETLVKAFARYYANGSHKHGSAYIQQFVAHCVAQEVPQGDIPRFLLGTVFNNVANSIPTAFWFLYRILSDPEVLADCREELSEAVRHNEDGTSSIDLAYVLGSCPVLMSTWKEVFRFHGMANSVRVVSEDLMLAEKYLLKKGGLVMMSARAQHINPEVWGDDVLEFKHRRFLRSGTNGRRSVDPAAFRAFGGGTTLCPGRHFATSEIMLLAAMVLVRFDVKPKNGGGAWVLPSTVKSSQAEAVEQPDEDVEVELVPRAESVGRTWRLRISGHSNTAPL